jgi:uncharacterized protein DUF6755
MRADSSSRSLEGAAGDPVPLRVTAPGQAAVVLAGLAIGALLMSIQLWLLTVALDLYLGGNENSLWPLAIISGLVFLGGILALFLLGRG